METFRQTQPLQDMCSILSFFQAFFTIQGCCFYSQASSGSAFARLSNGKRYESDVQRLRGIVDVNWDGSEYIYDAGYDYGYSDDPLVP